MDLEEQKTPENLTLHRFEYIEEGLRLVDWVWLEDEEVDEYLQNRAEASAGLVHRVASAEEMELYDEAYQDGYGVAMVTESSENYNGVTFRLDGFDSEGLEIETTKMFECAICGEHKDFDTNVAMANGFYLSIEKKDILWHACYDCTVLELSVDGEESSGS